MTAQQGHVYNFMGQKVMAMDSGEIINVREVRDGRDPWDMLGSPERVHSSQLKPLPMVYFGGQVPQ